MNKCTKDFLQAIYNDDLAGMLRAKLDGANVDAIDRQTGLAPIHIAVGMNNLLATRYLLEECNAALVPDQKGRWPTVIAAQSQVGDQLSDYIVEKEAQALKLNP